MTLKPGKFTGGKVAEHLNRLRALVLGRTIRGVSPILVDPDNTGGAVVSFDPQYGPRWFRVPTNATTMFNRATAPLSNAGGMVLWETDESAAGELVSLTEQPTETIVHAPPSFHGSKLPGDYVLGVYVAGRWVATGSGRDWLLVTITDPYFEIGEDVPVAVPFSEKMACNVDVVLVNTTITVYRGWLPANQGFAGETIVHWEPDDCRWVLRERCGSA